MKREATAAAAEAGSAGVDVVLTTEAGGARGGLAEAAALGVAAAGGDPASGVLLVEVGASARRRPTLLASEAARELERAVAGREQAAARGNICWLAIDDEEGDRALARLGELVHEPPPCRTLIAHLPPALWARALERDLPLRGGLVRADLADDRDLAALAVAELRSRGLAARVAKRGQSRVATRRSLAGLEAGGEVTRRARRAARILLGRGEGGQALPLVLGGVFAVVFAALVLAAVTGAVTGAGRVQRAADLAALSGARSMRDDFERLMAPARLASGAPNPAHLPKDAYLARATSAAREAGEANGVDGARLRVRFPDADSFAPLRVRTRVVADLDRRVLPGRPRSARRVEVEASATAEASMPASSLGAMPAVASGGAYSGPLEYRQGKPMRPDVALAFDRMAAAARRAGVALTISSGFRSDSEQAALFAQNPDPRWVAPPGKSLHRCATELDIGPPGAYGWLAANAPRFGFLKRYSWEPWHFGFVKGPAPCSEAADRSASRAGDGRAAGSGGLPSYVPSRFRAAIERASARWNVSAALLAAQLLAESNFNPLAVSPAGARGIAQFMPGTAAAYGLRDPFDAGAAIDAQAHLMSDLLRQFRSTPLALAAYNAGPGAVAPCSCVPPYPETQAYVSRIMGLLGGAGELAPPPLEVRLVR